MSPTISGNKSLRDGYANQVVIIIVIIIITIVIYLYSACTFQY